MKLGILVNTNRHAGQIIGITKAAVSKGHEVKIFIMDEGTKLLSAQGVSDLGKISNVRVMFCENSARQAGAVTEELPEEIVSCGQYNNAVMSHESDRVIVL
jgi:predicted peroxiredoxin